MCTLFCCKAIERIFKIGYLQTTTNTHDDHTTVRGEGLWIEVIVRQEREVKVRFQESGELLCQQVMEDNPIMSVHPLTSYDIIPLRPTA